MSDLIKKLKTVCQKEDLLPHGSTLLLAVSGGLDSMVLLHVLHRLKDEFSWRLQVAHYNHRLRGHESNLDAEFVEKTACSLGLSFHGSSGDVREFATSNGISLEMAARTLRHQFLAKTARLQKCAGITIAHHADDQVELFWMRLLRGIWGTGLSGMRRRSPSPADKTVHLIRPLLSFSRQELVCFSKETNILFREDSSNHNLEIERNQIRHQVLPILQEATRSPIAQITVRFTQLLAEQQDFIEQQARAWHSTREPAFAKIHPSLQRQVIHDTLVHRGLKPTNDLIDHLLHHPKVPIQVIDNVSIERTFNGDVVDVEKSENALGFDPSNQLLSLENQDNQTTFGNFQCNISRSTSRPAGFTGQPAWFDARTLPTNLVLRHWQPGDRFHKIGMDKTSKLQDIFVNSKIPLGLRRKLVLLTQTAGPIVWVESIGVSDVHKVSPSTTEFLGLQWHRLNCGLETD